MLPPREGCLSSNLSARVCGNTLMDRRSGYEPLSWSSNLHSRIYLPCIRIGEGRVLKTRGCNRLLSSSLRHGARFKVFPIQKTNHFKCIERKNIFSRSGTCINSVLFRDKAVIFSNQTFYSEFTRKVLRGFSEFRTIIYTPVV